MTVSAPCPLCSRLRVPQRRWGELVSAETSLGGSVAPIRGFVTRGKATAKTTYL